MDNFVEVVHRQNMYYVHTGRRHHCDAHSKSCKQVVQELFPQVLDLEIKVTEVSSQNLLQVDHNDLLKATLYIDEKRVNVFHFLSTYRPHCGGETKWMTTVSDNNETAYSSYYFDSRFVTDLSQSCITCFGIEKT